MDSNKTGMYYLAHFLQWVKYSELLIDSRFIL